jgi:hypothetical protein
VCINFNKEDLEYNNKAAYSCLNNLLKTKFNNNSFTTNSCVANQSSLDKKYEKLTASLSQPRTTGPSNSVQPSSFTNKLHIHASNGEPGIQIKKTAKLCTNFD